MKNNKQKIIYHITYEGRFELCDETMENSELRLISNRTLRRETSFIPYLSNAI
jgi:hypothetical protein